MMSRLTYSEAKHLIESCKYSHLKEVAAERHIVLSPKFLGNVKNGVVAHLNSELQLFASWTDGVLIAYNNVKIKDRTGRIFDETPHIHFNILADFIVFRPTIGCLLKGTVNKKSQKHVGCLVHRCFNASIHKPHNQEEWEGSNLQLGDEFIFQVKKIYSNNGVVSIRGTLCEESFNNIQRAKAKHKTFSEGDYSHTKGDNSMSDHDSGIGDIQLSKSKKKKKKKASSDEDKSNETMEVINEQKNSKTKKHKHKKEKEGHGINNQQTSLMDKNIRIKNESCDESVSMETHSRKRKHKESSAADESVLSNSGSKKIKKEVLQDGLASPDTSIGGSLDSSTINDTPSKAYRKEAVKIYKAMKQFGSHNWTEILSHLEWIKSKGELKDKWKSIKNDSNILKRLQDKYGSLS